MIGMASSAPGNLTPGRGRFPVSGEIKSGMVRAKAGSSRQDIVGKPCIVLGILEGIFAHLYNLKKNTEQGRLCVAKAEKNRSVWGWKKMGKRETPGRGEGGSI